MLGLGLGLHKYGGAPRGKPPLYDSLLWYSKKRDGSNVIDEISKDETTPNNGELIFDPATEIIDLSKYNIVDGTGDHVGWKVVKFNLDSGSEVTYRVISTAETLEGIKGLDDIPKGGDSNNYILNSNIDLINIANWIKIGTGYLKANAFSGSFNGNGFSVDNLTSSANISAFNGLFSSITEGSVSNLTIKDAVIGTNQNNSGILAGININATIINCSVVGGQITSTASYVGGLVGQNYSFPNKPVSIITNSYSTSSVVGDDYVGGLVGWNNLFSTITNSYSTSSVTGNDRVGGFVGYNYDNSTITNSYSTGDVSGNDYVGGFIGWSRTNSTITNSYSTGDVSGNDYVGGFIGWNHDSSTITNSYFIGIKPTAVIATYLSLFCGRNSALITNSYACQVDAQGDDDDIETVLNFTDVMIDVTGGNRLTTEMKDIDTFVDWDFASIWGIDSTINSGYPYLRMLQAGCASWLSNYKIVNLPPANVDGYIKLPTGVEIEIVDDDTYDIFNKMSPIYNEDNTNEIPYPTGSTYYLGDTDTSVYTDEENYLWHIDELNTETILSYLKTAYKFLWFAKNTFETGTLDPKTVKEIFVYPAPITDADDLSKIMKYLKIDYWYDTRTWDDDELWID